MKLFTLKKLGPALLLSAAALLGIYGCEENRGILLGWIGGDDTAKNHTHTWGNWTVTIPATCDAAGVETRTCTQDASHKETRAIARLTGAACNTGGGVANGSDLVGDWMLYSESEDGKIYYNDDGPNGKNLITIFSSGEAAMDWGFKRIGNGWVDRHDPDWAYWRIEGQTLIFSSEDCRGGGGCGDEARIPYVISGNKLTWSLRWENYYDNKIDRYFELTYTRFNVNSLDGPVYNNDTRLYKSGTKTPDTYYEDLFWYSQNNKNDYIGFHSDDEPWGTGLFRYLDIDTSINYRINNKISGYTPSYYTTGNKLFLTMYACSEGSSYCDDDRPRWVVDAVELPYTITGSGFSARLSINGDIWLPANLRDFDDLYPRSQSKRSIAVNSGESFISQQPLSKGKR